MLLSQDYFSFLLKVSAKVCCFRVFACIAWVNFNSIERFMCRIKCSSLVTPTQRSYCICCMSALYCFRFLIWNISTLQTFYPHVYQCNVMHASLLWHKSCYAVRITRLSTTLKITSLFHTAVCMRGSCTNSLHPPLCESFRCGEGGNLAPALIHLWR